MVVLFKLFYPKGRKDGRKGSTPFPNCLDKMVGFLVPDICKTCYWDEFWPFCWTHFLPICRRLQFKSVGPTNGPKVAPTEGPIVAPTPAILNCWSQKTVGPNTCGQQKRKRASPKLEHSQYMCRVMLKRDR